MTSINWTRISQAVEFYKSLGFEYIETPWHVDRTTAMITCPNELFLVTTDRSRQNKNNRIIYQSLVGSAEQGFMQLALDGKLDGVNYVSAGPCFREELQYDDLHLPQFFKVELFVRCQDERQARQAANELLYRAKRFMQDHSDAPLAIVEEGFGWDLQLNGVEVGSYGYRCADSIGFWAYGTGIAEPRFSQALGYKNA